MANTGLVLGHLITSVWYIESFYYIFYYFDFIFIATVTRKETFILHIVNNFHTSEVFILD